MGAALFLCRAIWPFRAFSPDLLLGLAYVACISKGRKSRLPHKGFAGWHGQRRLASGAIIPYRAVSFVSQGHRIP